MDKFPDQILNLARGLTARQRVVLVGGTLLIGAIVWGFVAFSARSEHKPLYSGMAPADAQALTQRLMNANIVAEVSSDGSVVRVRADEVDRARLASTATGPISSGRMGVELFDQPN